MAGEEGSRAKINDSSQKVLVNDKMDEEREVDTGGQSLYSDTAIRSTLLAHLRFSPIPTSR